MTVDNEAASAPVAGQYPVTPVDEEAVDRFIVTELKEQVLSYFGPVGAPA